MFSERLEFLVSIPSEAEVESGSRDKEVTSRFWFKRNHKAVARFQPKLSLEFTKKFTGAKVTPFYYGERACLAVKTGRVEIFLVNFHVIFGVVNNNHRLTVF